MIPAGRVRFRPRFSVAGIVSSVIGALGILVFLQQRGKVFPTATVGVVTLVAGVVVGVALPSLGRLVATVRINRRLALLDEQTLRDPGPTDTAS